jgi:hypothetical protein
MSSIADLTWQGRILSWRDGDKLVRLKCAAKVLHALPLRSGGVAAVVRSSGEKSARASLRNLDGTLRVELENPWRAEQGLEFSRFAYEGEKLLVFLGGGEREFSCAVQEKTGALAPPQESR